MTAVSRMFNGTTFTFGTAVGKLVGLHYKANGQAVDVSEPEDANKLFEAGQVDLEVTAKVKRMPTVAVAAKNTATIAWKDGSTTTLPGTWTVISISGGGDENSPISGEITFKPTVPDGA